MKKEEKVHQSSISGMKEGNCYRSCCCCFSVPKSYLCLCDPMDCSMPGSFVLYCLQSLLKFMSTESVMLSNHLIFCFTLLLLPSIFPSIGVFSNELALCIRWPLVSVSATVFSMNIQGLFPLWLTGLISLQSKGLSRVFSYTTIWRHQSFAAQPSLWSHTCTWLLEKVP